MWLKTKIIPLVANKVTNSIKNIYKKIFSMTKLEVIFKSWAEYEISTDYIKLNINK